MTRRCLKPQHNHRATQRDGHARRIIKRRIKGKMIGQTEGMCTMRSVRRRCIIPPDGQAFA